MMSKQWGETMAMLMIGDGVLSVVNPQGHVQLWKRGPQVLQKMLEPFVEHPTMTRLLGVAEAGLGIWLALSQEPE